MLIGHVSRDRPLHVPSRLVMATKCTKKCNVCAELLVCFLAYCFFGVLVAVAVVVAKAP